jgi:hypothetical protein
MNWDFGPIDPGWLFSYFAGVIPDAKKIKWSRTEVNAGVSGSLMINRPFDEKKPLLVVYACCHGAQLVHYLNCYGPGGFNVAWISNYRWRGSGLQSQLDSPLDSGLFSGIVQKATHLVYHPAYPGTSFDPSTFPVESKVSFHSPSFEALWGISEFFGEWPVMGMLSEGLSVKQAQERWKNREMKTYLDLRFDLACRRLLRKDDLVQVKLTDYFLRHFRHRRLFLTTNHPNFPIIAWIGQNVLARLFGLPIKEDETLAVPDNPIGLDYWPDCWYACHDSALEPFSFPPAYGDLAEHDRHYLGIIERVYSRFEDRYRHSML